MILKFGSKEWFVLIILILLLTDLAILLNIPFLRQILGFLFLTLLPGLLILQILKINKLNTIETILYSLGLSIAFLMFTGYFMNTLYPPLGILKPISTSHLMITISIILLILSVINYLRNRDFSSSVSTNIKSIKESFSPSVLLLTLLPIMSILGMCMVNFYGNNVVLLILIVLISSVVVLAAFEIIPVKYYPLAIVTIALALVFYGSLITFYIVGEWNDMATEFYFYNLVRSHSYWDSTIYGNVNAMLSVTIFPAIFSKVLNVTGEWVFRIIYPLIFAFVPLTLYQAYQKQTDAKIAFLSSFFFMAMPTFFTILPIMPRMCIAELFFALLILLMVEKRIDKAKRALLSIIFAVSLAVSHYGTSYFYMFYLLVFVFISFVVERESISNFWEILRKKIKRFGATASEQLKSVEFDSGTITKTFVLIYVIFALSWYMYMSSSSAFNAIVRISDHMYSSIFTDLLTPEARELSTLAAVGGGLQAISLWHTVNRYIWYIIELFIIVGVLSAIIKYGEQKFKYEYVIMLVISGILLAMCIVLPFFSSHFSMMRIYHMTLFFLAPCCVIGGRNIFRLISKLLKRVYKPLGKVEKSRFALTTFLLIILIPYFLFNSGVIFTFTDDLPSFGPLSAEKHKTSKDINVSAHYLAYCIPTKDFIGAKWLSKHKNDKSTIYTGLTSKIYLLTPYPMPRSEEISIIEHPNQSIENDAFVYLRSLNIEDNKMVTSYTKERGKSYFYFYYNTTEISQLLYEKNKIYSNGGSEIYR